MLQRFAFTAALTIASRFVQLRDRLLGRVPSTRPVPVERTLALSREPLETGAALDQHHAQDLLELLQSRRHGRLGHAADLRSASEVPLLGERQQQFKLVDQPDVPLKSIVASKLARPPLRNTQKPPAGTTLIAI